MIARGRQRMLTVAASLAFTGSDGSGYKLFVVNADGTNLRDISSGIDFPGMPDWSPDSKRIAFATGGVSNSDVNRS